jgi:hypothetical protein
MSSTHSRKINLQQKRCWKPIIYIHKNKKKKKYKTRTQIKTVKLMKDKSESEIVFVPSAATDTLSLKISALSANDEIEVKLEVLITMETPPPPIAKNDPLPENASGPTDEFWNTTCAPAGLMNECAATPPSPLVTSTSVNDTIPPTFDQ